MNSAVTESNRASITVDPRSVQGCRKLKFSSFDEMLADAAALTASPNTRTLGNWPLHKLIGHLAVTINKSIDGISIRLPWYIRFVGWLIKGRLLKGLPPGVKLPKDVEPDWYPNTADNAQDALEAMRGAVARLQSEKMTARHPVLGKLTHEQWIQYHLRHAELHLSFALAG
jgi:hypothetical protein